MHYYQFNIADYRKDTTHLTPMEHYIYRWLIDQYYLDERPLNAGSTRLCRLMGLPRGEYESMVTSILYEFFEPVPWPEDSEFYDESHPNEVMVWRHERIDEQIEEYQGFIERQSAAGKASAKKRAEKKLNSGSTKSNQRSTSVQPTTNHKPITNKEKTKAKKNFKKPTLEEVSEYCRERSNGIDAQAFIDHYEANGWKVGRNAMKDWKAAVRTWEKSRKERSQQSSQSGWDLVKQLAQ